MHKAQSTFQKSTNQEAQDKLTNTKLERTGRLSFRIFIPPLKTQYPERTTFHLGFLFHHWETLHYHLGFQKTTPKEQKK